MHDILQGIEVFIIFVGLSTPLIVIGVLIYLKKRLEHKQIMAAIEKGTSLSELKPSKRTGPPWIKNLTAAIALLIIAIPLLLLGCLTLAHSSSFSLGNMHVKMILPPTLMLGLVLFAIGISRLIRGLLQRNAERQIQLSNQNGGAQTQSSASACDAESLAQTDK